MVAAKTQVSPKMVPLSPGGTHHSQKQKTKHGFLFRENRIRTGYEGGLSRTHVQTVFGRAHARTHSIEYASPQGRRCGFLAFPFSHHGFPLSCFANHYGFPDSPFPGITDFHFCVSRRLCPVFVRLCSAPCPLGGVPCSPFYSYGRPALFPRI